MKTTYVVMTKRLIGPLSCTEVKRGYARERILKNRNYFKWMIKMKIDELKVNRKCYGKHERGRKHSTMRQTR